MMVLYNFLYFNSIDIVELFFFLKKDIVELFNIYDIVKNNIY